MSSARVLVTGGTGFVGRHVVTALLEGGQDVAILARDPGRVPRELERARVIAGDLERPGEVEAAVAGCRAVVHAARAGDLGSEDGARREIAATTGLLDACVRAGVGRFVHVSTTSVYALAASGTIDETAPRTTSTDRYARVKVRLEAEALARAGRIEVVVLQPSNVYGPGPSWWSRSLLDLMRRGKLLLVDGGEGTANLVHVTDVARAAVLALSATGVSSECFLLTDGAPVTWREYFLALESVVGHPATLPVSVEEARRLGRSLRDRSVGARASRFLGRAVLGRPLIFPWEDDAIDRFASRAVFSIAKARERLGYAPRTDLARGIETVREDERVR